MKWNEIHSKTFKKQRRNSSYSWRFYLYFKSLTSIKHLLGIRKGFSALVYYRGPVFFGGFWNHSYSFVRGQIYGGMGAGVRGRSPLLGEGIRRSVRLGRLGIGMISKSPQKDRTLIVHQCRFFQFFEWNFNLFWMNFFVCFQLVLEWNCTWKILSGFVKWNKLFLPSRKYSNYI